MPNDSLSPQPFDFLAFRDLVAELNRFEKFKHAQPHYPEPLWHRALQHADQRHTARALSNYYLTKSRSITSLIAFEITPKDEPPKPELPKLVHEQVSDDLDAFEIFKKIFGGDGPQREQKRRR
jgi:hypothetical protein